MHWKILILPRNLGYVLFRDREPVVVTEDLNFVFGVYGKVTHRSDLSDDTRISSLN
jgi:hypothetical protein